MLKQVVSRCHHPRHLNLISEFTKSIKRQIKENKEFQQNVNLLSEQSNRLAESDTMLKAKEAMKTSAQSTSQLVQGVGKVVEATLETPVVKATSKAIYIAGETVIKTGQKVRGDSVFFSNL